MPNHSFADRLAAEISPSDTPLADIIYDAYLEGGATRAELFDTGQPFGAFSGEVITALLPKALSALQVGSAILLPLLTAENLGKLLDCIQLWLKSDKKKDEAHRETASNTASGKESPEWTQSQLRVVLSSMEKRLIEHGLDSTQAEYVALRTLKTLLDEPDNALHVITQMTESLAGRPAL